MDDRPSQISKLGLDSPRRLTRADHEAFDSSAIPGCDKYLQRIYLTPRIQVHMIFGLSKLKPKQPSQGENCELLKDRKITGTRSEGRLTARGMNVLYLRIVPNGSILKRLRYHVRKAALRRPTIIGFGRIRNIFKRAKV